MAWLYLPPLHRTSTDYRNFINSATLAELEQRAIALGERFATSKELGEALHVAHGADDPRTAALVEELAKSPFALPRAFNDI